MVFKFFKLVLSFSKGHNSSNGSLDQTWRVYKRKALFCISDIDLYIYLFNSFFRQQTFANWFLNLFELLLLPFAKSFPKFSSFPNLENCAIHLFHSLLPLPKIIHQGLTAWILFVSLFSLSQKNEGLTAWILLCLPSPLSKNSKRHSLRILLILPFPIYKIFQRTNHLRILLYPHSQSFKGLTAWELCLNTLEGTSFVVEVEGTSTWVVVTENKRGYISCGSVLVKDTSTRLLKENKGGYIPCGSFLVKEFYKVGKEISRTTGRLGTECRHRLLPNQYKNSYVFVSFFPTLLISAVHFISVFYFWLSFFFVLHLLNNIAKALEE